MIGTERTFADRQRAAIERLGIGIALLLLVEIGDDCCSERATSG